MSIIRIKTITKLAPYGNFHFGTLIIRIQRYIMELNKTYDCHSWCYISFNLAYNRCGTVNSFFTTKNSSKFQVSNLILLKSRINQPFKENEINLS
jgi:hypothetical protein